MFNLILIIFMLTIRMIFYYADFSFFWVLTPPLPEGVIKCGYDDCTVLSDPVTVISKLSILLVFVEPMTFFIFHIVAPPMIEFLSANTTVDIGADISLNCEAAGYPEPNIAVSNFRK